MSKEMQIRPQRPEISVRDYPYDSLQGIKVERDEELSKLVGRLLTYIDATYTDIDQRKAHKRILKDTIYTWYYDNFDDQHSERSLRGYSQEMTE